MKLKRQSEEALMKADLRMTFIRFRYAEISGTLFAPQGSDLLPDPSHDKRLMQSYLSFVKFVDKTAGPQLFALLTTNHTDQTNFWRIG